MITYFEKRHNSLSYRILSAFIAFTFIFSLVLPPGYAQLIPQSLLNLPVPGTMVPLTNGFTPTLMTGITIHPDNPLRFDFIMDRGQSGLAGEPLKEEYKKMIKYFMASLTVPEDELWVNLSPYEKDRMVPQGLGDTEMGRDMLAQDYLLKQLTASLMYPEKELGKEFWDKVYQKAREKFGTTEIPVNTFNKVWIVPDEALVYEQGTSAFVIKSRLAVMLEEDYMAVSHQSSDVSHQKNGETDHLTTEDRRLTTQVIREIILPEIEKEVNEGENFASLRQIYNALILATWYKQRLKDSLLGKVYVDQNKTKGIDTQDKGINQKIYGQYIESFKRGVYNFIKEDVDPATQQVIPRKYFSGGMAWKLGGLKTVGALALGTLLSFGSPDFGNASALAAAAMGGNKDGVTTEFVDNADQGDIGTAITVREGQNVQLALADQLMQEGKSGKPDIIDVPKMYQWVKSHIHPKTGLVKSFPTVPEQDASYSVTWMYNQAQAIQDALAVGDLPTAERLVRAALRLKRNKGAWYSGYLTDSGEVATRIKEQNLSWVGPNMALGHGLLNVLERTTDQQLAEEIVKVTLGLTGWVEGYYFDKGKYAYVSGGEGSGEVWTEHNERVFAFYYQLYNQFNNPRHKNKIVLEKYKSNADVQGFKLRADKIIRWIQTDKKEGGMWAGDHYLVGYKDVEGKELIPEIITSLPGDHPDYGNRYAWGYPQYLGPIMASIAGLNPKDFAGGMDWLLAHLSQIEINGKMFKGVPRWLGTPSIWAKGTSETVVALQLLGRENEVKMLLPTLAALQTENGGILAAVGDSSYGWPIHFPYESYEGISGVLVGAGQFGPEFIADLELVKPPSLNFPDATVRLEGAPVDPAGVKFEGDVYIYNHAGQPVKFSEQAGRFFPKTPAGEPLVKDTVIVIKPSADAVVAVSPIVSSPTGRKLTSVVLAFTTTVMICLSGCAGPGSKTPEPPPPITKDFDVNSAVTWMYDQINLKTNLIRSFQNLPLGDPSYGVTWIYNQAQAIEGFLAAGEVSKAKRLADGLLALQGADGAWFNAYATDTGSVATNLFEQYTRWVGPNVVVGRALVDVTEASGDGQYTEAAMKLTGWLDKYFVDRGPYGYLTGGVGVPWTSTEHNMRAMAFYDRVGDKPRADLIAVWLNTKMYNPQEKRYYVGYSSGETVNTDPTMATDVQYLGPLMAQHGGRDPQAFAGGIDWLLEHQTAIVLDNQGLVGIPRWLNVGNSLWFEGIGELVGALQVLGREEEIDKFLSSIKAVQASDGSLPAAIGGTSGWPGDFPYSSVEAVGSDIAAVLGDPRHMARPLAGADEQSPPETELRAEPPETSSPVEGKTEFASSPVSIQQRLIGTITALILLWGMSIPAADALEMSLWKKFDEPTERARMINEIALAIINLGDEQTGLAPSYVGHPGFEKLKFVYDAAVDALVLKAAGKQKDAEKILDYFADRLAIPLQEVAPYADTNGIAGILKVWKTDEFNVRGLINALDRTSTKPRGQGMLEYYSTPGPMAFIVMAFLNVNKERYLPVAVELGNALLSLQRPDGGLKDGDRSPNRVHIEPHMDSFATFLQLYQATNDKKWKTAAEKAWQFFIKSDAYHPQDGVIWQGIWEFGTNKVFATDAYSWTMAGPGGDRMSLYELEKFTETMLAKSLTRVTLEVPDGKTKSVILVDFTDPQNPQVVKERGGFHPMGSVEWAGGVIAALQKNAVRFWEKGNPQQKEKARHYKALAEYLIANSLYAFYEIPGLEGMLSFYATGQNVQTGHGWRTPFFYVKSPGVTIKGGSLVSAWPVLPIQGLNPFDRQDPYKKSYDAIPISGEDKERALQFVALSVVNRSFKEAVPTKGPDAATQIVEPGNYNLQMWNAFVRGDYKKSMEWAQRVVNDPDWIRLARRDQEQKAKEIGGLVRYPWGIPSDEVPKEHQTIWRYPLLNEMGAAMWGLAAANFELGNTKESKKWMRRIIEEIPYHQIAAGHWEEKEVIDPVTGKKIINPVTGKVKTERYFVVTGYWNALISWEFNPGNVRRDAQMGVLYREVLREMGLRSAAPKEISIRGPQILPVAPESRDKLPVTKKTPPPVSEPKPKVETKVRENVWLRGSPGEYVSRQWQARATYAEFDPPLRLQKGQKIKISYSLTGSDVLGIQLIPVGVDENMRGDMIVKRGVGGSDKTLIIEVPSDRKVWRIAFQYGNNAWGPLGGSVDAVIQIHTVEIYDEQHSGLGTGDEIPASLPAVESRQTSDISLQPDLTTDDGRLKTNPGGIDLNPALLDLQIKRDGNGVPLPLPQQPIENMHIDGFLPIIINVTPIANLPLLLGLADTEQDADEITPAMKAREPEEVSYLD